MLHTPPPELLGQGDIALPDQVSIPCRRFTDGPQVDDGLHPSHRCQKSGKFMGGNDLVGRMAGKIVPLPLIMQIIHNDSPPPLPEQGLLHA